MNSIELKPNVRVLVLTGAGVSAESGIPTFRGMGGFWGAHRVEEVASLSGFIDNPALVWRFYSERRVAATGLTPNAGHRALARLEAELGDRFLLATQNVDGLHSAAGSERVVEMHGSLWRSRCSRCDRPSIDDRASYDAAHLPACGTCHQAGEFALLRPDIVWFGERLAAANLDRIASFIECAKGHPFVFLAVGTSGQVSPASELVVHAKTAGAKTWLVNLEAPSNVAAFDHVITGESARTLPELLQC